MTDSVLYDLPSDHESSIGTAGDQMQNYDPSYENIQNLEPGIGAHNYYMNEISFSGGKQHSKRKLFLSLGVLIIAFVLILGISLAIYFGTSASNGDESPEYNATTSTTAEETKTTMKIVPGTQPTATTPGTLPTKTAPGNETRASTSATEPTVTTPGTWETTEDQRQTTTTPSRNTKTTQRTATSTVSPMYCNDHGVLTDEGHCNCEPTYKPPDCRQKLTKCDIVACLHDGKCILLPDGSFKCECPPGYTGAICETGSEDH